MPKSDGSLSSEEVADIGIRLNAFWDKNGGRKPCPSCGNGTFFIHPSLLAQRSDAISPLGEHFRLPSVVVYCQNCGFSETYVARLLGVKEIQVGRIDQGKVP